MNTKNRKGTVSLFVKSVFEMIETILISVFVISLIFSYLLCISTVKGDSMKETLQPQDKVIALRTFRNLETGDIVIANADKSVTFSENGVLQTDKGIDKVIIKRVIATGGQTIDIDFISGNVYVDGEKIFEDYVTGLTHNDEGAFTGKYPFTVPDGYVFVLGDNRRISKDSRSSEIGLISEDDIIGRVLFRIYPLDKFGKIK